MDVQTSSCYCYDDSADVILKQPKVDIYIVTFP
jgi:hypothetical protein